MSQLISSIRQRYGFDIEVADEKACRALQHLRENMQEALRSLSEDLYAKDTHFVLEFVQNADDNDYKSLNGTPPHVSFSLDSKKRQLSISCNEDGFSAANIEAICSVGKSTKKNKLGYIGEKGIGFKSVYKVADVVYISSTDYTFKFDKREELGMVIPIWTKRYPVTNGLTSFVLKLSRTTSLDLLAKHLNDIQPTLLLFLRKLRHIEVAVDGVRSTYDCHSLEEANIIRLSKQWQDNVQTTDYLLVRHMTATHRDEPKREGIQQSEIVLAFPVSAQRHPIVANQPVHAFLPIRTQQIPFIIQADFLLAANREDILVDSQWNLQLRQAIPTAYSTAVLEHFANIPNLRYDWPLFFPKFSADNFLGNLRRSLIDTLSLQSCLLCDDGVFRRPSDILICRRTLHTDAQGVPLIPGEYVIGQYYLHRDYKASRDQDVFKALGATDLSCPTFLAALENMNRAGVLVHQSQEWLERVSVVLLSYHDTLPSGRRHADTRAFFYQRVKALPLVSLVNGCRVSVSREDLFFDMQLGGIPTDLGIGLVQRPTISSSYYRLLECLGIEEASAQNIVKLIAVLHARGIRLSASHVAALPSHARFLFHHARYSPQPAFRVLTSRGTCASAENVYMNRQGSVHLTLQRFIDLAGVNVLHDDYYNQVDNDSMQDWLQWLRSTLNINAAPRIINGLLSPEFRDFTTRADTATFLNVLRHHWGALHDNLANDAIKELRGVMVTCIDRTRRRIDSTFANRAALQRMTDLPFLPLPDPENEGWDFLKKLGVTLTIDSMGYLKLLVRMKESGEASKDVIEDIYRSIESRFADGHTLEIRDAFKKQCLILVPTEVTYSGPVEGSRWMSSENAVHGGPRSMQTRLDVIAAYPNFRKFFVDQLKINKCPSDILLHECRALAGSVPLRRLNAVLNDICEAVQDQQNKEEVAEWLPKLAVLNILPVRGPDGKMSRQVVNGDFLVPDKSGELAKLFGDQCTLLHVSKELPLPRLKPLLHSPPFSRHIKELVNLVSTSVTMQGTSTYERASSRNLSRKIHYVRSLINVSVPAARSLPSRFRVFKVDAISYRYTFNGVTRDVNRDLTLEVKPDTDAIEVYISQGCSEEQQPVYIAQEMVKVYCTLTFEDLCVVLSMPTTAVEKYLESKGIPDVPHEDLPDSELEDEQESRLDHQLEPRRDEAEQRDDPGSPSQAEVGTVLDTHQAAQAIVERNMDRILRMSFADSPPTSPTPIADRGLPSPAPTPRQGFAARPSQVPTDTRSPSRRGRNAPDISKRPHKRRRIASDTTYDIDEVEPDGPDPAPGDEDASAPPRAECDAREIATGILGELYMYKILKDKLRLPGLKIDNWTSERRGMVPGFGIYEGAVVADFIYTDQEGALTEHLFGEKRRLAWEGRWPTYHIEVKSTAGAPAVPFLMRSTQIRAASTMTHHDPETVPAELYVLARVWSVQSDGKICFKMYPDPHRMLYDRRLKIVSDVEMVITDP